MFSVNTHLPDRKARFQGLSMLNLSQQYGRHRKGFHIRPHDQWNPSGGNRVSGTVAEPIQ